MSRILITGASRGVGLYIYNRLKQKHHVYGVGHEGPDGEYDFYQSTRLNQIHTHMEDLFNTEGPFDILINNIGVMPLAHYDDYDFDMMNRSLIVNFLAPYWVTRTFVEHYKRKQNDQAFLVGVHRIVNMTSQAVRAPGRCCPGYAASKAALEAATRAMAREIGSETLIFACIAPAGIENTWMQESGQKFLVAERGFSEEDAAKHLRNNPMGRLITHEEVFKVFKFAVEQMPAAMNGTILTIPLGVGN